jgi:hypothetical protein
LDYLRYAIEFAYPFGSLSRLYLDPEVKQAILNLYDQLDLTTSPRAAESAVAEVVAVVSTSAKEQSDYPQGAIRLTNGIAFTMPLGPVAQEWCHGTLVQPPTCNSGNNKGNKTSNKTGNNSGNSTGNSSGNNSGNITGNSDGQNELSMCTEYQLAALGRCLHAHSLGDFCIVGPKGVGKSFLSRAFADIAGYTRACTTLICLYKDMTTRDLFEGRRTKPNGDTYWELSALLTLSLQGGLAVLDGVEQIHPATLASLQRLVLDREVTLPSGKRFMSVGRCLQLHARLATFSAAAQPALDLLHQHTTTRQKLHWLQSTYQVYAIHPSFRIVALARPPAGNRGLERGSWMTAENCTLFPFVWLRPLSMKEEQQVLESRAPQAPDISVLVQLVHSVRSASDKDEIISSISESLSTRQLIRLCKQREVTNATHTGSTSSSSSSATGLYEGIHRLCLSRFMPSVAKAALEQLLADHHITRYNIGAFETHCCCCCCCCCCCLSVVVFHPMLTSLWELPTLFKVSNFCFHYPQQQCLHQRRDHSDHHDPYGDGCHHRRGAVAHWYGARDIEQRFKSTVVGPACVVLRKRTSKHRVARHVERLQSRGTFVVDRQPRRGKKQIGGLLFKINAVATRVHSTPSRHHCQVH